MPGNHDHQLVAPWLERRRRDAAPPPLGLEQQRELGARRRRRDRRRLARARAADARLPRHLAARRRLRDPRPLPRPPHDRADLRAALGRRDGADRRPPAAARRRTRRLRGGAGADLRLVVRARAAARRGGGAPRGTQGVSVECGARSPATATGRCGGGRSARSSRSASRPSTAPASARSEPTSQAPRSASPGRARWPTRSPRWGASRSRAVRPHPPQRPAAAPTTPPVWRSAGGVRAAQHRHVGLRAPLPHQNAGREPVLARPRDRRRRRAGRRRRGCSTCSATAPGRSWRQPSYAARRCRA